MIEIGRRGLRLSRRGLKLLGLWRGGRRGTCSEDGLVGFGIAGVRGGGYTMAGRLFRRRAFVGRGAPWLRFGARWPVAWDRSCSDLKVPIEVLIASEMKQWRRTGKLRPIDSLSVYINKSDTD